VRHLIICCDGTWQTTFTDSNVVRLRDALARTTSGGIAQEWVYVRGVGTTGTPVDRIAGGLAGVGLSTNIMRAYRWLAEQYRDGDVVALFGFSRGAYTARSLAGVIGRCGLLDTCGVDDVDAQVAKVYRHYRSGASEPDGRCWRAGLSFRYDSRSNGPLPVHFIGVWDTVGSLGIPDQLGLPRLFDRAAHRFHDVRLDCRIPHARHAIALDDTRGPFAPTLWRDPPPGQDVKQVWFPGTHLDVGGGHPDTSLSDGALRWMMDEAQAAVGLAFDRRVRDRYAPDPLADRYPLLRGFDRMVQPVTDVALQPWPRAVPRVDAGHRTAQVHESAYRRQDAGALPGGRYRPTRTLTAGQSETVEVTARSGWSATGLWLEPGTYTFTADGTWRGAGSTVGPDGGARPRSLADLLGSTLTRAEGLLRWAARQVTAGRFGALREPDLPWMSLVGYVTNETRDDDGTLVERDERIAIGTGTAQRINRPGYLYAFANDAWGFYPNNGGAVRLTVSR
jgi:hypothetical protein